MAAKKLTKFSLAELLKRTPPNQMKQFEDFRNKTIEYHRRVNQYPEKLPRIDWEFYRNSVRKDYVKMVEQFQIKYEELKHVFASRYEALDFSKYYKELDELTTQAQEDVKNYIAESNTRIKIYENEINRIKSLTPYENMTLEQFVTEREDIAKYIPGQGKPLFWPHDPTEQVPDYDKLYAEIRKSFKPTTKDDNMAATSLKSTAASKCESEFKNDKKTNDDLKESPKVSGLPEKSSPKTDSEPEKK